MCRVQKEWFFFSLLLNDTASSVLTLSVPTHHTVYTLYSVGRYDMHKKPRHTNTHTHRQIHKCSSPHSPWAQLQSSHVVSCCALLILCRQLAGIPRALGWLPLQHGTAPLTANTHKHTHVHTVHQHSLCPHFDWHVFGATIPAAPQNVLTRLNFCFWSTRSNKEAFNLIWAKWIACFCSAFVFYFIYFHFTTLAIFIPLLDIFAWKIVQTTLYRWLPCVAMTCNLTKKNMFMLFLS